MSGYSDSLTPSEGRTVDWKYTGKYLQIGELVYKNPKTGAIQVYECNRRVTKNQMVDGSFVLPILKGSCYSEPHLLLIHCFRPAVESYTVSIPAGIVDKGETPEQAALRELTEETGYVGKCIDLQLPIPYFCDPWKSNEQQMVYVVEVDMDLEENKHPIQHLDESEDIHTDIIALSDLSTYIQDQLSKGYIVSAPLYTLSLVLGKNSFVSQIASL